MKIALGTVQFGMNYGLTNINGKVALDEVEQILKYAVTKNIDFIDTAQAYGESEKVLGKFDLSKFKIISKVSDEFDIDPTLQKLNLKKIYGILIHYEKDINERNWDKLQEYKYQNYVEKIGISIYSPIILEKIIDKFDFDIIQLPFNLLDQRFSELLPQLKSRNIEIHSRSTFLQGLLLQDINLINPYFNPIKPILNKIPGNRLCTALKFVSNNPYIDKIVVGVTSLNELTQIVEAYSLKINDLDSEKYRLDDERYILPQNWRLI